MYTKWKTLRLFVFLINQVLLIKQRVCLEEPLTFNFVFKGYCHSCIFFPDEGGEGVVRVKHCPLTPICLDVDLKISILTCMHHRFLCVFLTGHLLSLCSRSSHARNGMS